MVCGRFGTRWLGLVLGEKLIVCEVGIVLLCAPLPLLLPGDRERIDLTLWQSPESSSTIAQLGLYAGCIVGGQRRRVKGKLAKEASSGARFAERDRQRADTRARGADRLVITGRARDNGKWRGPAYSKHSPLVHEKAMRLRNSIVVGASWSSAYAVGEAVAVTVTVLVRKTVLTPISAQPKR